MCIDVSLYNPVPLLREKGQNYSWVGHLCERCLRKLVEWGDVIDPLDIMYQMIWGPFLKEIKLRYIPLKLLYALRLFKNIQKNPLIFK